MKCKYEIFRPNCVIRTGVCLLAILIFFYYDGYAQTKDSLDSSTEELVSPPSGKIDSFQEAIDTGNGKISIEDSDKINKWKHSREFAYMHYLDSLLRKRKDFKSDTVSINDISGKITRNNKPEKGSSGFNKILNSLPFKIFFWALAIIFIAFVGYNVLFKNGIFAGKKRKSIPENGEELSPELDELSRYDELISGAEYDNNFNLATRYLYLKTLKNLSEKEIINFLPDKTNLDYLNEMKTNNYFEEFKFLTRNYEYLWYGKFLIEEKNYRYLKEKFISFNKKV